MNVRRPQMRATGRAVRRLSLSGVVGPLLFASLVVAAGVLYDGYSHVGQTISELGAEGTEYALLQNLNFLMLGVTILGFAWTLARVLGPPILGSLLIGFFGLSSAIANGLLPCDVGCQGAATVGLMHNVTGLTGFVAAIAGMVVLARRWRNDPHWRLHASFTGAAAFVALIGLVGFVATKATKMESIDGLVQRVFVVTFLVWIAVTASRLYREAGQPDRVVQRDVVEATRQEEIRR